MVKATTRPEQGTEPRWRIVRITQTPAKLVGHVYAPDEETALKLAN
jgi:1,2-phenylacetyl-CoA epoxidase PaaB subunit